MEKLEEDFVWNIIDTYFRDNPQALVRHHIESYNDFLDYDLSNLFRETNPLKIDLEYNDQKNTFQSSAQLFFGGREGKKIYYGKPIIYDEHNSHYMFPNEARLRNMTYALPIYCDIDVEITRDLSELLGKDSAFSEENDVYTTVDEQGFKIVLTEEDRTPSKRKELIANIRNTISSTNPNIQIFHLRPIRKFICNLPIMAQSKYCILNGIPRDARFAVGECKNDFGGYFIIDGKEKTVICQEKFGDNMLYVRKVMGDDKYLFSAEIRSVSENISKPIRTLSIKIVAPSTKYSNRNIVVMIPNVKKPVPLFILFRALGILSDREIIAMCLLKDPKEDTVSSAVIDWFLPSIHDAATIQTQQDALEYLSCLIKGRTITRVLHILADYFLPHIGEICFLEKAYFLGHMTNQLFMTSTGIELPTDRDNYKYKRVELLGSLLRDLFREYFLKYTAKIRLGFETRYEFNKQIFQDISNLIYDTHTQVFEDNLIQEGIRKAFKGNWGADPHTKRIGVVQDLNRLSNNGTISHLRKTNLPLDPSVKLVGPRVLHCSQWGIIDPIDTPDGGNIGIHKYLSMMTYITRNHSREGMLTWIRNHTDVVFLADSFPIQLGKMTKVMVNGLWIGSIAEPIPMVFKMKECRRHALIPISTSISYDNTKNTVFIYTDGGRLCRPIFYRDETSKQFAMEETDFQKRIKTSKWNWMDLITGFHNKKDPNFDPTKEKIYEWTELYAETAEHIREKKAVLEYVDSSESENILIALNARELQTDTDHRYTHCELHESTLYGVMCNQINYIEHNPATRNSFSCGQSKQACSLYHTNYTFRMDKTAVVLNSGQIPLIKPRYMKYINNEENPYGENAIVAIMCFTGYNVEDAILVNEGALKRGLFRTTYYTTYEAHEEKETKGNNTFLQKILNIEEEIVENSIAGIKPGYDYSKLDANGLIQEETVVDDKTVLIGISTSMSNDPMKRDTSKMPKKGQVGVVDKAFITEGEEGQRIAKVRIREERIPAMGDKMASRAGQKGTVGMIIAEEDMPFTKDGIRPDLIINPHALPSRMTIGQMVECISGKACANYGAFGDCTAFLNLRQNMVGFFGELLSKLGFHSSGNEIMYDGMSGEQIESEIFMGPTYYMRLKHMVKDKINFRARGPNTNLTRQPVSGRANDGGLRIGEMERDAVMSHGTADFLRESMMERGDVYHMAVCNKTGMIAVYNPSKDILFSPMADGPIQYTGSLSSSSSSSSERGGGGGSEGQIHVLSKYGRDFSIVAVPYAFKLFMQELMAINIRMCIITEDNISQIENMGFSTSLDSLLFQKNAVPKTVIDQTRTILSDQNPVKTNTPDFPPNNKSKFIPHTPDYTAPNTPDFPQENTTTFIPHTPDYTAPNTPEFPQPTFIPHTPNLEKPDSPDSTPPNFVKPSDPIEKEIKGGDHVHYRGDNKPQRIWKVQHAGKTFFTIDTEDPEGLNTEDSIRVVPREQIYSPEDFTYSVPYDFQPQTQNPIPGFGNIPLDTNMYPSSNTPCDTQINFAPVIKIINDGNDMSSSSGPSSSSENPLHNLPNPTETETKNEPIDFDKPIIIKKL
jgi:DNA-directed RNA polymerase II subunit RPB2